MECLLLYKSTCLLRTTSGVNHPPNVTLISTRNITFKLVNVHFLNCKDPFDF